jgi:hypothetical protein
MRNRNCRRKLLSYSFTFLVDFIFIGYSIAEHSSDLAPLLPEPYFPTATHTSVFVFCRFASVTRGRRRSVFVTPDNQNISVILIIGAVKRFLRPIQFFFREFVRQKRFPRFANFCVNALFAYDFHSCFPFVLPSCSAPSLAKKKQSCDGSIMFVADFLIFFLDMWRCDTLCAFAKWFLQRFALRPSVYTLHSFHGSTA